MLYKHFQPTGCLCVLLVRRLQGCTGNRGLLWCHNERYGNPSYSRQPPAPWRRKPSRAQDRPGQESTRVFVSDNTLRAHVKCEKLPPSRLPLLPTTLSWKRVHANEGGVPAARVLEVSPADHDDDTCPHLKEVMQQTGYCSCLRFCILLVRPLHAGCLQLQEENKQDKQQTVTPDISTEHST